MGLIARKSAHDDRHRDELLVSSSFKAQSYHATAPSLPPVRGHYPVAGNGPNPLASLQHAARKRSESSLPGSLNGRAPEAANSGFDYAAPAPLVPRLHGSDKIARPSTANASLDSSAISSSPISSYTSSRPKTSGRSRRDSIRGSISFLKKTASHNDFLQTLRRPDTSDGLHSRPPVPPLPSHITSHSRSSHGSGNGPTKAPGGYVDILDAQSEFKPSDFRSRVKAAGARDYGEDVAERNMGENGTDLNSAQAKAFYASGDRDREFDYAPAPAVPRGDQDRHRACGSRGGSSIGSSKFDASSIAAATRPISPGSNRLASFPTRTTSFEPWRNGSGSRSSSRRHESSHNHYAHQSEGYTDEGEDFDDNTSRAHLEELDNIIRPALAESASRFCHSPSSSRPRATKYDQFPPSPDSSSDGRRPRPRPLNLHPVTTNFSMPSPTLSVSSPRLPPEYRNSKGVPGPTSAPRYAPVDPPPSPMRARDSLVVAKKKSRADAGSRAQRTQREARNIDDQPWDESEDSTSGTGWEMMPRPRKTPPVSYKGKGRMFDVRRGGVYALSDIDAPTEADLLSTVPAFLDSELNGGMQTPSSHRRSASEQRASSVFAQTPSSRPSTAIAGPSRGPSYARTRSLGGSMLPPHPRLDNISEFIPERTSSRRHWSISSSTAPTMSSSEQSSNAIPGTLSRYTADTSTELSHRFAVLEPSHSNDGSAPRSSVDNPDSSTYFTAAEDGVSTDDTSTPGKETPKAQNEDERCVPVSHGRASFGVGVASSQPPGTGSFEGYSPADCDNVAHDTDNESLLFHEAGYGGHGAGLPGLFDEPLEPLSPAVSEWSTTQHASADSTHWMNVLTPRDGRSPPEATSKPMWPLTDSEPLTASITAQSSVVKELVSLPAPASDAASIATDPDTTPSSTVDVKLDGRAAAQLRKEMKKRNRAATMERRAALRDRDNVPPVDITT